jgi:MFS family permease
MLFRFSLYGFLKNQRYFEPFLVLLLLDAGLSFLAIGSLITLREGTIAALEIPSGAVADRFGRRRAMVGSFVAYLVSFPIFATASSYAGFATAMVLFGVGEAFRTGTHKAIIFSWLKRQGRSEDKTKVYGYTRSWSKLGSATSALIGAGLVLWSGSYEAVFWLAMVPYAVGLLNLATYPGELDRDGDLPPPPVGALLRTAFGQGFGPGPVRRLILESMAFDGLFASMKDYLQPVLLAIALAWTTDALDETQRTAVLVGLVYFGLFLLAAAASRHAHRLARPRAIWLAAAAAYGTLLVGIEAVAVVGFVALYALQNIWRPVLVSRIDDVSDSAAGSTLLSVESQARRLTTMVLAPLLGWAVDTTGAFWPLGAVGLVAAVCATLAPHDARPGD